MFRILQALWSKRQREREMQEELHSHIAMRTEDNLARGMAAEEARRDALLRFGNPAVIEERAWEIDLGTAAESWWRDLVLGLHSLRRSPAFALIVLVILGLGVGANSAVFTLAHAFLWRNLPVPHPGRLVRYMFSSATPPPFLAATTDVDFPLSGPIFDTLRKYQHACTDLFLWSDTTVVWTKEAEQQSIPATLVTGGAFDVLGIHPALGRRTAIVQQFESYLRTAASRHLRQESPRWNAINRQDGVAAKQSNQFYGR